MTRPLTIATHTPNGEVRTADLLTSISKRLRQLSSRSYNAPRRRPDGEREEQISRFEELLKLATQIEQLAKTLEGKQ